MLVLSSRRLLQASVTYPYPLSNPSILSPEEELRTFNHIHLNIQTLHSSYSQRDFSMKFRSKFDKEEVKKSIEEKMNPKGLPDPRGFFEKVIGTISALGKGASWFLWFTNA